MSVSELDEQQSACRAAEADDARWIWILGLWLGVPCILALLGYVFFLVNDDAIGGGGGVMLVVMLKAAPVIMLVWGAVLLVAKVLFRIFERW